MAGFAGLLALIGSAGAFIYGKIVELTAEARWKDDVAVVMFQHPGDLVLANTGSGDVYVSHLEVYFENGNRHLPVDVTLTKGKVGSKSFFPDYQSGIWLANKDGVASLDLRESATVHDASWFRCIAINFFSKEHSFVRRMDDYYKQHGSRLIRRSADKALVYFVEVRTGKLSTRQFDVELVYSKPKDCEEEWEK